MSVLGPVPRDQLGIILPHEHLFIDLRNQFTAFDDPEKHRISQESVCMSNLGYLRCNPYAIQDNLVLDDVEVAVEEAMAFERCGGQTIVDCTSIGIHREPLKLREVAKRTGLNIIAGCGYYTHDTHPPEMDTWNEREIANHMLHDMQQGIGDTDIRAGIYGEIGTSDTIRPNEKKVLCAVALAFAEHRAEIQVHTYPWATAGLEAAQILIDRGVDPAKIVICHIDIEFNQPYLHDLLKLGVNIEFDNFGKEYYINKAERGFAGGVFARDIDRVRVIRDLLDHGYEKQLLITNDICLKSMLRSFGGNGYDHILRNIVPMMLDEGIAHETIDRLMKNNPARILTQ